MDNAGVLEVSTPVLSHAATTDPQLRSFKVIADGQTCYLHTSPEFPMKRLLAAHQQDIYQIVPVFRDAERGHKHNPEFTMLEWYRVDMDHHQLMDSMEILLHDIFAGFDMLWHKPKRKRYCDLVEAVLPCDMQSVTTSKIKRYFDNENRSFPSGDINVDAALDLFFDTFVLPTFAQDRMTFITEYPASQAALARTAMDSRGNVVASRFELYFGSLEIANGYHELIDAEVLLQRIAQDIQTRKDNALDAVAVDAHLIEAHQAGLPDCAGVAVGFDRLLMLLTDANSIDEVVAFSFERA